jgi:flagella basal body P-ring formation protein FlgA
MVLFFSLGSTAEGTGGETTEVPEEAIRQEVVQFLERNHPWKTAEVRIRRVRVPSRVVLRASEYDLSVRVPPNTRYLGHTPVEITFNTGKRSEKRVWGSAYLEVLGPVVIARNPMARNQMITTDDVCLEKRDLAKVPPGAMTSVDAVIGQRLRRTLGVGAVLRKAVIEKPPVVNRGDVVKLLVETATLKITALGRVDEQGGVGDTIRVTNLDSKRRVYGEVIDNQTVRIKY